MYINNTINKLATAHNVMLNQAGNRIIVSFSIKDNEGNTVSNSSSHYSDIPEVIKEWDTLIKRYGEDNVTLFSTHGDAIAQHAKKISY